MNKIDELAREQLRKHGVDRYPTAERQFFKLVEEIGELSKEINTSWQDGADYDKIKKEMADVALSLFNLASKLYIDLGRAVEELVSSDARTFTHEQK